MEAGGPERRVNLHTSPKMLKGVYANFANVSSSDYEFTLTFARVEHEIDEGELPGIVVSNINMSPRFTGELIAALQDAWSKWETRQGIKNLPEYSHDDENFSAD